MEVNKPLPLMSVMVPMYNIAQYAPQSTQSLMKQTFEKIDII